MFRPGPRGGGGGRCSDLVREGGGGRCSDLVPGGRWLTIDVDHCCPGGGRG